MDVTPVEVFVTSRVNGITDEQKSTAQLLVDLLKCVHSDFCFRRSDGE